MTDDELAAIVAKAKLTVIKSKINGLAMASPIGWDTQIHVSDYVSEWLSQIVLDKVHSRPKSTQTPMTGGDPRHRKRDSDAGGPRCCSRSAMGRAS